MFSFVHGGYMLMDIIKLVHNWVKIGQVVH